MTAKIAKHKQTKCELIQNQHRIGLKNSTAQTINNKEKTNIVNENWIQQ